MTEQWICPQCQQVNMADMHFCPHCGAANPALATSVTTNSGEIGPTPSGSRRRLLWTIAIGLWMVGCVVVAIGGGMWWARQESTAVSILTTPVVTSSIAAPSLALPTATPTLSPSPALPTATPMLSPSPEPTVTPSQTPVKMETSESAAGDSLTPGNNGDSLASAGDTLIAPTSASAGVILFLSSRDHDPQTEAEQRKLGQNRELELYAMRPDGSDQIRLSPGNQGWGNLEPSITPYFKPNQVVINGRYVFDLATRQMVNELQLEFTLPGAARPQRPSLPAWSPRGEIVFCCVDVPGVIYYLADPQAKLQPLTSPPADAWGDGFPAWSPDGEWIIFMRNWYNEAQDGLWLMKPDGSEAHRIIPGQYSNPRRAFWSPDGRRLAYEGPKSPGDFSFEVWVAEADGGNPRRLTSLDKNKSAWEPKWSPDGQRIVFNVGDSYRGDIFVIDANGGEPNQLTSVGDANLAPLWLSLSPDDILSSAADQVTPLPTVIPQFPTPTLQPVVEAPKPTPVAPSNCPNPGVQITSPQPGAVFTDRDNFIIGTANINRFHHWRLEYSTTPGGGWNYLFERDYPVDNDKLMMLDASTVPNGPYGLRLTVVDETGNYPQPCEVWYTNSY